MMAVLKRDEFEGRGGGLVEGVTWTCFYSWRLSNRKFMIGQADERFLSAAWLTTPSDQRHCSEKPSRAPRQRIAGVRMGCGGTEWTPRKRSKQAGDRELK